MLRVQLIDRYLGNMFAIFSFKDDYTTIITKRNAEAFLDEYHGENTARLDKSPYFTKLNKFS